ncbi:MAG TPA: phosphoribosylglycinamide formyltransferase [Casimicrobiaceae bacterium]|nr:phosphoribosylglycinamide formyltransferase [Casimicrobiaceae bacterium]
MAIPRITVLASGRGSNLRALIDAERAGRLGGTITAVVCNRAEARALEIAAEHGIATQAIEHRAFASRDAFDEALAAAIDAGEPDLIVLAGFMRVLGAAFVARYAGRMLNIHPSLLPSYPGLDTHKRALADGVRVHGCTVHFVTADVDHGPIVMQGAVAVHDGDDEEKLAARVLAVEHQLLPAAVRAFCEGRLVIAGRRVCVKGEVAPAAALMVPLPIPPVGAAAGDRPHAS